MRYSAHERTAGTEMPSYLLDLECGERVVLLNTGSGLVHPEVSPLE
jgi:hypothetical protein